jgi:hypothetical protein
MNEIIIFVLAVIVHEIGHYLSYISLGVKPSIKLTWFGGILMGGNVYYKLTPLKAYFVNVSGILYGAVVLSMLHVSINLWLIYVISCSIDVVNVLQLLSLPKKWKNNTLLEISQLQVNELKEKN